MKKGIVFTYAFIAAFGALVVGLNMGGISGAIDLIEIQFSLTPLVKGFVTGALMIGCLFGALFGGSLSDRYGRKPLLIFSSVLLGISAAGCAFLSSGFNMVWEPGFEYDPEESISNKTLWNIENAVSSHDAHTGNLSCRLSNKESGVWKDACTQTVMVKKNTDYKLVGWAKGSFNETSGSYLGVRLPNGKIIDSNPPLKDDEWTQINVEFNSGNNSTVEVFFGTWGQPGLTVNVDDITMKPLK